ncbi:Putative uncharacterized protein [Moritella viscosa]|nr:Putative uncharacterized protein [Moritella viscosa]SHO19272.1 Putative uncharacterized protein [Moritella viscosa]
MDVAVVTVEFVTVATVTVFAKMISVCVINELVGVIAFII